MARIFRRSVRLMSEVVEVIEATSLPITAAPAEHAGATGRGAKEEEPDAVIGNTTTGESRLQRNYTTNNKSKIPCLRQVFVKRLQTSFRRK